MAATRQTDISVRRLSKTRGELIKDWHDLRAKYNNRALQKYKKYKQSAGDGTSRQVYKLPTCQICQSIYGRKSKLGIGTKFYRSKDGSYVAECGGGKKGDSSIVPCAGFVIPPETYIDSATFRQELQVARDDLIRELKHIRDRVFATEHITEDDDHDFKTLTREYMGIRRMGQAYQDKTHSMSDITGYYTVNERGGNIEERGVNPDSLVMRSNKIFGEGDTVFGMYEFEDMVLHKYSKDDLPVKM